MQRKGGKREPQRKPPLEDEREKGESEGGKNLI